MRAIACSPLFSVGISLPSLRYVIVFHWLSIGLPPHAHICDQSRAGQYGKPSGEKYLFTEKNNARAGKSVVRSYGCIHSGSVHPKGALRYSFVLFTKPLQCRTSAEGRPAPACFGLQSGKRYEPRFASWFADAFMGDGSAGHNLKNKTDFTKLLYNDPIFSISKWRADDMRSNRRKTEKD